ncbi:post-COAP-1 domain-containing protein [Chloroflexota bacterium]
MKKKLGMISLTLVLAVALAIPMAVSAAPTTVTLDPAWEKTSNRQVDATLGTTLPCDDSYWAWTSTVWDGPSTNGYGAAIPPAFGAWAYWNVRPPDGHQENTFYHYWFRADITVTQPALLQSVKLVNKANNSILSVNDDIFVYVNGTMAASGGTGPLVGYTVPAGFVSAVNNPSISLATDGHYINNGLTIPVGAFSPGLNHICILMEDFWDWGGLAEPVFELTYTDPTLGDMDPLEAYNPVGTDHTVSVQVTPALPGVIVNFVVEGDNAQTGEATTDGSGVATFSYTGNSPGQDTIWAFIDLDDDDIWDDGVEPKSTGDPAIKYWFQDNFLTGGGTIKDGKKPAWNLSGNVGYLPDGTIVGNFNIVDHANKNHYKCHNAFTSLVFSGTPTTSPPASYHIATFTGTFTDKDGATYELTIIIEDNGEPGKDTDKISVTGAGFPDIVLKTIDGGNYQVHDGFK